MYSRAFGPVPMTSSRASTLALAQSVIGLQQVGQTLALLEAPDEQDVQRAVAQLLERLGIGEEVEVDPVRDDRVVAGEVA